MDPQFIVICRADQNVITGEKGRYELATREVFTNELRAETYAQGISSSREPMVIPGDFDNLRFPIPLEDGRVRFATKVYPTPEHWEYY